MGRVRAGDVVTMNDWAPSARGIPVDAQTGMNVYISGNRLGCPKQGIDVSHCDKYGIYQPPAPPSCLERGLWLAGMFVVGVGMWVGLGWAAWHWWPW